MKKQRIIAIALVLCLSFALLAACGGTPATTDSAAAPPSSQATQPQGQVPDAEVEYVEHLVCVGNERVPSFDATNPASTVVGSMNAMIMIYNKLLKELPDGTLVPQLAESWEIDDEFQVYSFKLRDDVTFHNGEKFTADDVAFTVDRAKSAPGTNAYDRLNNIESYEIVNDYEIVFTLTKPNVDFIYYLAWPACGIVNREAIEADAEKGHWIGTGPFTVSEFVSNDYITFERNEDYWGDVPVTKYITFRHVGEETARFIMLENGEAQMVWALAPMYVPSVEDNPNLDYVTTTFTNTAYIGFNQLDPLMADINFRMAVAHAINREEIVLFTREGFATVPENPIFWGYRTEFRNENVPKIEYDLDKAREYLEKTSYSGQTIEILTSNPNSGAASQVVLANLADIGINIVLRQTDQAGLSTDATWGSSVTQMHIHTAEWQNVASSSRTSLYPGVSGNRANYNNPEVAALLDEALTTFDTAEREAIYMKVQEIVAEEIPYIFAYHHEQIFGIAKGVDGFVLYGNSPSLDYSGMYMIKQ